MILPFNFYIGKSDSSTRISIGSFITIIYSNGYLKASKNGLKALKAIIQFHTQLFYGPNGNVV